MRTILIATFMLSVTFHLNAKIIYIELSLLQIKKS
jgi:hypothetical protein